jgi:DNA-binding NtrC family response regulator
VAGVTTQGPDAVRSSLWTRDIGFEVHEAGDSRGALAAVGEWPDVEFIVLDVRLPDCRDLALLTRLRTLVPDARIIVMTAHGTQELFDEAMTLGAFTVLSKPFELAAMAETILRARTAGAA